MHSSPIVWIDFETGGVDPDKHAALEFAAYIPVSNQPRFMSSYIREPDLKVGPNENVTPGALAVNQIPMDRIMTQGKGSWEVASQFSHFLMAVNQEMGRPEGSSFTLGGHNITFDYRYLLRLYRLAGHKLPKLEYRMVDTASIMRFLVDAGMAPEVVTLPDGTQVRMPKIDAAFHLFNIKAEVDGKPVVAHTALGDAVATHDLYLAAVKLLAAKAPTLKPLFG